MTDTIEPNPMFLLMGTPRSGTTLLAGMLDASVHIVVPDETDFIIPAAFVCDRVADEVTGRRLIRELILSSNLRHSIRAWLSDEEVAHAIDGASYALGAIVRDLYSAIARKAGKRMAGDKSPNDLLFVRILEKVGLFDDAGVRIIHLVRDVRGVMASLREVGWSPAGVELHFPRHWCASNLHLYHVMRSNPARSSRYLFLRFEDLVRQPGEVVSAAAEFLGVPFHEEMLDAPRRAGAARGREQHRNIKEAVQPARAIAWRQALPIELQQLCLRQAREAIEEFGFDE